MIPKIIYYTWISEQPIPDKYQRFIDNWSVIMPDYEIRPITLENCPKNDWVNSCIKQRKFVLAGHYARIKRLYETGGIYFDIDVEVLKSFEGLLDNEFFIGCEKDLVINNAVMGSVAGHIYLKEQLDYTLGFDISHQEVENETGPRMTTKLLLDRGWQKQDKNQLVGDIQVYSSEYFYPYLYSEDVSDKRLTKNTYAIHHWASTWVEARDKSKVSIIIPCYNQAEFLAETIESCLAQTYKNIEIIVVSDASPDNSVEIAKKYPVKVIECAVNGGVGYARNTGIKASTGNYIMCLDSDDTIEPEFVEKCVGQSDIACPLLEEFGEGARDGVWHPLDEPTLDQLIEANRIFCSSMFTREVWEKTGGYDESIRSAFEDWDLWIRAKILGFKIKKIPYVLFNYRKHANSMTVANIDKATNDLYMRLIWDKYKNYHS